MKGSRMDQTRLLLLNDGENLDATVFRLCKGWRLCFACGPSLQGKRVRLFCNHPMAANEQTGSFYEVKWSHSTLPTETYDKVSKPLNIVRAGSFRYFFTVDGSDSSTHSSGCGYFVVQPVLTVGDSGRVLPLDAVACQTVLPKLLGLFCEWENRLQVSYESGYNMIHFTPPQRLNSYLGSCYSISDQFSLDSRCCGCADSGGAVPGMDDLERLVRKMANEWGMLSIADVVINHTATDSPWLVEHPHSGYNLVNSPHLRPAYLMDRILWHVSLRAGRGQLLHTGIPPNPTTWDHVRAIEHYLRNVELPKYRLHEFYTIDVEQCCRSFEEAFRGIVNDVHFNDVTLERHRVAECTQSEASISVVQDPLYRRLQSGINMDVALSVYRQQYWKFAAAAVKHSDKDKVIQDLLRSLRSKLCSLNDQKMAEFGEHVAAALEHTVDGIRWRFLDANGPKVGNVSAEHPLVDWYFVDKLESPSSSVEEDELRMNDHRAPKYIMAVNGWVRDQDPLKNFAEPWSNVYLRRELMEVWADSVKLRYGRSAEDSPYLWKHMTAYLAQSARIFHGVRLDNLHNTPLHVAEYMLAAARHVRPDLYVVAELFTSGEHLDNEFVNRLGLTSVYRQALWFGSSGDQATMVGYYGGLPVGSFFQPSVQLLRPSVAHALVMDMSHDNYSPVQLRSVYDMLPTAAVVSMAACATGSNRGYDELVPHQIHVVRETRLYPKWSDVAEVGRGSVDSSVGIIAAKARLNRLHQEMGMQGLGEIFTCSLGSDTVAVTRHHPLTRQSVICVARHAFSHPHDVADPGQIEPLRFEGEVMEVVLFARLEALATAERGPYLPDPAFLNGLYEYGVSMKEGLDIRDVPGIRWRPAEGSCRAETIEFERFMPGSVLIIRVSPGAGVKEALHQVEGTVFEVKEALLEQESGGTGHPLLKMTGRLSLTDYNEILFWCEPELEGKPSQEMYSVPNYGPLVYVGLQGILSPMARISAKNDLGHPVCDNLREGLWLPEYLVNRLAFNINLKEFAEWLRKLLKPLYVLPNYIVPCYFDMLLSSVKTLLYETIWKKMPCHIYAGLPLTHALAVSTLQFCSALPSHSHGIWSADSKIELGLRVASGLPHSARGDGRSRTRDVLASMRGLLLLTGRFAEARSFILAYASLLRGGLIPNTPPSADAAAKDGSEPAQPCYDSRDTVWWWLKAIRDYCEMAPGGYSILKASVQRQCVPQGCAVVQPLEDVMQEAMEWHADGDRSASAGKTCWCDANGNELKIGTQPVVGTDWTTGFVYGGTGSDCGTWMDSICMDGGMSKPATPRNGSAVELVGLCAATVRWMDAAHTSGIFGHKGVYHPAERGSGQTVFTSYRKWHGLISANFEKYFWIDGSCESQHEANPGMINKRGIYKDCLGSDPLWADYQLRPNFVVSMVEAPELFAASHARLALEATSSHLLGPLGMRTLDPNDWAYHGDCVSTGGWDQAHGYHNGPEWLWPVGYFLRAQMHFSSVGHHKLAAAAESRDGAQVKCITDHALDALSLHHLSLENSDWKSLPAFTNADGKFSFKSCPAQAWSVASVLEAVCAVQDALAQSQQKHAHA